MKEKDIIEAKSKLYYLRECISRGEVGCSDGCEIVDEIINLIFEKKEDPLISHREDATPYLMGADKAINMSEQVRFKFECKVSVAAEFSRYCSGASPSEFISRIMVTFDGKGNILRDDFIDNIKYCLLSKTDGYNDQHSFSTIITLSDIHKVEKDSYNNMSHPIKYALTLMSEWGDILYLLRSNLRSGDAFAYVNANVSELLIKKM